MTTLKVGIASYEEMKARTMSVTRGERRVAPNEPNVWFTSTESFAKVLSARNRELLRVIAEKRPARWTNWPASRARPSPTCRARCGPWKAMAWSASNAASAAVSHRR